MPANPPIPARSHALAKDGHSPYWTSSAAPAASPDTAVKSIPKCSKPAGLLRENTGANQTSLCREGGRKPTRAKPSISTKAPAAAKRHSPIGRSDGSSVPRDREDVLSAPYIAPRRAPPSRTCSHFTRLTSHPQPGPLVKDHPTAPATMPPAATAVVGHDLGPGHAVASRRLSVRKPRTAQAPGRGWVRRAGGIVHGGAAGTAVRKLPAEGAPRRLGILSAEPRRRARSGLARG